MPATEADTPRTVGDLATALIACGRQSVVVPEQLVCAAKQMDFQGDRLSS